MATATRPGSGRSGTGPPPCASRTSSRMTAGRAGCDAAAVDPTTEEGRLTLRSYLWPDQTERLRLLDAALKVAARVPAPVALARAADWLERRRPRPAPRASP